MGVELSGSASSPLNFNVQRPGNLPVMLPISDETVYVRDVYGFPIQDAKVTLAAGNQVQIKFTNSSGVALFPQLPPGPVEGTIQYLTFSDKFSSDGVSARTIYSTATLSYPLLVTILMITALASYLTIRATRKRSKSGGYVYFFS
jgi:hypothetical protein